MELQHINLDDLSPARVNVRKRGGKDASDLIASIRALGLLQPLLVRPNGEGYDIVAGQRRYHALCALAEEEGETAPVPCIVMAEDDDATAIEASLAENVARLPMDEIDQYRAFASLVRKGLSAGEIASRFAISERLVNQRLAIANLLPPILTAYRKGEISPDTLRILTMATKSQQKGWLELLRGDADHAPQGYRLSCWLFGGQRISTTAALFVLDDYDGAIVSDLVGEDSYFSDPEAFWRAQNSAIAAAKEQYLKDGWADVVILETGEHFPSWEYVDTAKDDGGKVYVQVAHNGEVSFYEGQLTRKEAKARKGKGETAPKAAKPELTQPMQNYLNLHRHAAVRSELAIQPGLALRLCVAQIIAGSELWTVQAEPQKAKSEKIAECLKTNKAEAGFAAKRRAVLQRLELPEDDATVVPRRDDWHVKRDVAALFEALYGMEDAQVMETLAFVTAESLPADSPMVEILGAKMGTDMRDYWQPDPAFFDLLRNKDALNAMVGELAGAQAAAEHVTTKLKTQKAILAACLDGTRPAQVENWLPRYMAFPSGCYLGETKQVEETGLSEPECKVEAA